MSNLLTSLVNSATALRVFERVLVVSQNNVANVSTPGYAAQRLSLLATDFQPELGLVGGVRAGEIQSARSEYAEQAVRRQSQSLGFFDQTVASLAPLEAAFDISGERGIAGALNGLFQSFSAWSLSPNSTTARHAVIDSARQLAESFRQAAASLTSAAVDTDRQIRQTVEQINQLGVRLQQCNLERRGGMNDAGLDAKVHTVLEELSELADFTVLFQPDGSVTVLLGGQTPLVVGEHHHPVSAAFYNSSEPPPEYPGATPPAHVVDWEGRDITSQISQGRLGGLLHLRNTVLPSLRGDAYQVGDLNLLAKAIADRVNQILTAGWITDGPPPESGVPLFTYDATNDALVAQSLALNPGITPGSLAAIDPGPPYVGNGTAMRLAGLVNPEDSADRIGGFSYTEYYGNLAARVGRMLVEARQNQDFRAQTVAQARYLRDEISGVSLDEEAVLLVEFQRAYQAAARMVSVLSELTEITVNLLR